MPEIAVGLLKLALGLAAASFLAAFVHRYGAARPGSLREDVAITVPRSCCDGCGRRLAWRELVPVVSYLVQRGRCRCGTAAIPLIHPAMEGLAVVLWWMLLPQPEPVLLLLLLVLAAVAVIDFRHLEIPDLLLLMLAALVPIRLIRSGDVSPESLVVRLAATAAVIAILLLLAWGIGRWRKRLALGQGDPKLLALALPLVEPATIPLFMSAAALGTVLLYTIGARRGGQAPFGSGIALVLACHLLVDELQPQTVW